MTGGHRSSSGSIPAAAGTALIAPSVPTARSCARVPELELAVVDVPRAQSRGLAGRLRSLAEVRYVEPETMLSPSTPPNDPLYVQGRQSFLDRLRAPEAWDLLPADRTTIVAVLDTGIDYNHPEFAGHISSASCDMGFNGCSLERSVPARDADGHGTHVAGIIGAITGNGAGVASVSGGRVTILPIKVSLKPFVGFPGGPALQAIVYAVNNGARVINISFGPGCGAPFSQAWSDAIGYAEERDVLIVMSAGNSGGCAEGLYPAGDRRVISVAAVDKSGDPARFTNRGGWVTVAAPGTEITSTYLNNGYASLSGTSQAAPQVSALAALLYQVPGATRDKVIDWITHTCDPAPITVRCEGTINAYRAVHLAVKGSDPGPPAVASAAPAPAAVPPPPGE